MRNRRFGRARLSVSRVAVHVLRVRSPGPREVRISKQTTTDGARPSQPRAVKRRTPRFVATVTRRPCLGPDS